MHEKLKVEIQEQHNENQNLNDNNIKNVEDLKSFKKDEVKNLKSNTKENKPASKSINFILPNDDNNDKNNAVKDNQSPNRKNKNERKNSNNINNINNNIINNDIGYHYQHEYENNNGYRYSYNKFHSHHPLPHPHLTSIMPGIDSRHHHHHHHHSHRSNSSMKKVPEHHKKNIDFIDNLNAQFKFNVDSLSEKPPTSKTKKEIANKEMNKHINDNNVQLNYFNDMNNYKCNLKEDININENQQNNNHFQQHQHHHHHHYHPYSYHYPEYPNKDVDNNNKNKQGKKNTFDLTDIKVVIDSQPNKPLKKNISFSIDNDDLRCPSHKPHHLKRRMENRQRMNNKHYEILANTNELMLEKELNEREIQFYCLRVMEQNAQQKHSEILKQRKEKITDHTNHINKVRRQNVLSRSKWRCDRSHKMNCRQLKVEQNRRKIISNRKAFFASFVQKAKKVVTDLKKREEIEKIRIMEDLNEKMVESENRRKILKKISKSKILDVSSSLYQQQILEKKAALDIQRWWRKMSFKSVLPKFIDLDITSDVAKSLSFEKLHEKLHSQEAMEISRNLLSRIFKSYDKPSLSNIKEEKEKNTSEKNKDKPITNDTSNSSPTANANDSSITDTDNSSVTNSNEPSTTNANDSEKKNNIPNNNVNKHFSEEKMFLSAFMIYGHSKTVISSIGDTEKVNNMNIKIFIL